jgi:hypothetical protein
MKTRTQPQYGIQTPSTIVLAVSPHVVDNPAALFHRICSWLKVDSVIQNVGNVGIVHRSLQEIEQVFLSRLAKDHSIEHQTSFEPINMGYLSTERQNGQVTLNLESFASLKDPVRHEVIALELHSVTSSLCEQIIPWIALVWAGTG